MKKENGFTIIELLVGSVVMLILIGITIAFVRDQTRYGGQFVRDTGTRESLTIAMMLLKRDIMQAGYGFGANASDTNVWKLAVYMNNFQNAAYHSLYVSNPVYIKTKPHDSTTPFSVFASINKSAVFNDTGSLVFSAIRPEEFAGAIALDASLLPTFVPAVTKTYNSGTNATTMTLAGVPGKFSPCVEWALYDPNTNSIINTATPGPGVLYELRRNNVAIVGGGRDAYARVLEFRTRAQFINTMTRAVTWAPLASGGAETDFVGEPTRFLKTIEVSIRYQTRVPQKDPSKSASWQQPTYSTLNVNPRNVGLYYLMLGES